MIRLYIFTAIVVGMIATIGIMYHRITTLNGDLALREKAFQDLVVEVRHQETLITKMNTDIKRATEIADDLSRSARAYEQETAALRRRLQETRDGKKRDLAKDAASHSSLVESAINRGTRHALRCNQVVTGAPLTEDERSGKTVNTVCPDLIRRRAGL